MKKILIIPVLLVCLTGASSRRAEPTRSNQKQIHSAPINTRLDSADIKLQELNELLHQS